MVWKLDYLLEYIDIDKQDSLIIKIKKDIELFNFIELLIYYNKINYKFFRL